MCLLLSFIIFNLDEWFAKTVIIKICLSFRSITSSQMLIVLGVSLFSRREVTDGVFVVILYNFGFDEGFAKTVVIKICLSFRSIASSQMLIVLGVWLFSRREVTDGGLLC